VTNRSPNGDRGGADGTGAVPSATDSRGRHFELHDHAFVVEDRGSRRVRPLTDPGDPAFLELPRIDLPDGRSLRAAGFDAWAGHVRSKLASGTSWETTRRARKPYHTGFAILGGLLVGGSALWAVGTWATSDPMVRTQPGIADGLVLLAGLSLLLWIAFATLSSSARYWLTRLGSYARVDARGVTLGEGRARIAPEGIASATYHPLLRATHVRLRDGTGHWVPRETGPLARLDLVLSALPGGPPGDEGTGFTLSLPRPCAPASGSGAARK
jgi:hypothetical protein